MIGSCLIFYVAILVAPLISTTQTLAQETEVIAGGELEYQNHCAICHGVDGKGRGIMAKFLSISPSDLTQIAKKTAGRFSFWQVYRVIDGRRKCAGMGHAKCRFGEPDFSPRPQVAIPAHDRRSPAGSWDWCFISSISRND